MLEEEPDKIEGPALRPPETLDEDQNERVDDEPRE